MRTTRSVILLAALALLSTLLIAPASAEEPRAGGPSAVTLNELQARGTHNSYKLDPQWPGRELAGWDYQHQRLSRQFEEQDVRQIELDVHYNWARGEFEVYHAWLGDDRTNCRMLVDCLEEIRWWSDLRPHHHPLMILIEPKDSGPPRDLDLPEDGDPFTHPIGEREYRELDRVLLDAFDGPMADGGRVLTPEDVTVPGATLRESILHHGWPRVDDIRGTVFYVIDGHEHGHDYSAGWTSLGDRAAFVQAESTQEVAAFVARSGEGLEGEGKYDRIRRLVDEGFMVRDLTSPGNFEVAKAAGVHFISSDHPDDLELSEHRHAPSRCNPISAQRCQDHWIERRASDGIDLPDEPSDATEDVLVDQADRLVFRSAESAATFGQRVADDPEVATSTAERQAEVWQDFFARVF